MPGSPAPLPAYVPAAPSPFIASVETDRALAAVDLAGSIVHARMLGRVGLLTPAEVTALVGGLRGIRREIQSEAFPWRIDLEDVHTNIEVRLAERVGPVAGKLHTTRSRNDQIALDERLWLRGAVLRTLDGVRQLKLALLKQARAHVETGFPGYTHLQRAQPVSLAHHLLAHFWRLDRDSSRLTDLSRRAEVCPLGAGALAGTTLPNDPEWVARELGFARPFENSLDAVSDRDSLVEFLFALSLLAIHLSSFAEEVIWWASREAGFVRPTAALGAGSSLMPQKRNPDNAELVRGKAGRVVGDLLALLITLKGLPLSYNRDLQEDKPAVFDAARTSDETLEALTKLVSSLEFDLEAIGRAVDDPGLLATDAAEALVATGLPFRAAHEQVAARYASDPPNPALSIGRGLDAGPASGREAFRRRASPGGPGPERVRAQLAEADRRLAEEALFLSDLTDRVGRVDRILEEEAT